MLARPSSMFRAAQRRQYAPALEGLDHRVVMSHVTPIPPTALSHAAPVVVPPPTRTAQLSGAVANPTPPNLIQTGSSAGSFRILGPSNTVLYYETFFIGPDSKVYGLKTDV